MRSSSRAMCPTWRRLGARVILVADIKVWVSTRRRKQGDDGCRRQEQGRSRKGFSTRRMTALVRALKKRNRPDNRSGRSRLTAASNACGTCADDGIDTPLRSHHDEILPVQTPPPKPHANPAAVTAGPRGKVQLQYHRDSWGGRIGRKICSTWFRRWVRPASRSWRRRPRDIRGIPIHSSRH